MNELYAEVLNKLGYSLILPLIGVIVGTFPPQGGAHDQNRPEAIPIVISAQGFTQSSFALPAGIYAFVVINRTGFNEITVVLERMPGANIDGPAAAQAFGENVGQKASRVVRVARLTRGTYRIRIDGTPSWVSQIEVR